jgi:hypothetical protein
MCFDKIADSFNSLSASFAKLWNPSPTPTQWDIFMDTLQSSIGTIKNGCLNTAGTNQTCQEYIDEALNKSKIEEIKNKEEVTSMQVAFEWNKLQDDLMYLLDKEFWLNVPEACYMTSEQQAVGLAGGMEKQYENVQNSRGPPGGL